MSMFLTETDKAWLAGFIDGEGTIGLFKKTPIEKGYKKPFSFINRKSLVPTVQIVNSNLQILEDIKYALGFGVISRHVYETENWKGSHTLSVRAIDEVKVMLELITPYLRLKKKQAELLYVYCDEHIKGKSATEVETEIAYEIQKLNRVGKKNEVL